jgi:sugar phosphate isomerase/epimerase
MAITGIPSIARSQMQTSGIKLGFDSYSLRAFQWKAIQLIEYAAAQKLDSIQLSSLGDYETFEAPYLQTIRDTAAKLGVSIDGGIGCICPSSKSWSPKYGTPEEYILKGLKVSKAVGAKSMRCFMGASIDRQAPGGIDRHIENTIRVLKPLRSQAQDLGVKIAVENHSGDMQARELRTLIEQSGKDFVAACLDTGNPMWVVEDPLVTLEVLGPYTVTTHIRDSVVFEHPRGAAAQWVALGDGVIDFKRFVARFHELCPESTMQLENITGRPPQVLPYLEQDFWKAFPHASASEFARFVALAKSGHPFMGSMVMEDIPGKVPAEYTAALKEQQRYDLERGFAYARNILGAGIRSRT